MNLNYLKIGTLLSTGLLIAGCSMENPMDVPVSENKVSAVDTMHTDYPSPILTQAAVMNMGFRVMLFTLNEDRNVYLKAQTDPGLDDIYFPKGATNLGAPSSHTLGTELAAGLNRADTKVYLFSQVTASSSGKRLYYMKASGSGMSGWSRVEQTLGFGHLEVADGVSGLTIFATNSSGRLYCMTVNGSGTFSTPILLGNSTDVVGMYTVQSDKDGRLWVFRRSGTRSIKYIYQTSSTGTWKSSWSTISTSVPADIDSDADIQCCLSQSNYPEVFVNTTNRNVYSCKRTSSGTWSGWNLVGGNVYKKFEVERRYDGGLDLVYAKQPTNGFTHMYWYYQLAGSTTWLPGPNEGYFGYGEVPYVRENYFSTLRMTLFPYPYGQRLMFFVESNYLMPNGLWQIFMNYKYETDNQLPQKPNNWSTVVTLGSNM